MPSNSGEIPVWRSESDWRGGRKIREKSPSPETYEPPSKPPVARFEQWLT